MREKPRILELKNIYLLKRGETGKMSQYANEHNDK